MKYYLGLDIGSVSIKGVVINEKNEIVKSYYVKNSGLVDTIKEVLKNLKIKEKISGMGITGSGRDFIKVLIGGDICESEVISHFVATIHFYPKVKTIIDIGGEDCKLMKVNNGNLTLFNMNHDCVTPESEVIIQGFLPKRISDIKVGEKVLTHFGNFKEVLKIIKREHDGLIYRINAGSNILSITENHPILVLKRKDIKCYESEKRGIQICNKYNFCNKRCRKKEKIDFEPKFILPCKIEEGDFLIKTVPKINPINEPFDNDFLRFLGYYLAEGNITYNKARKNKKIRYESGLTLAFNIKEKDYINDVINIAKNLGLNPKFQERTNHRGIINIYDSKFSKYIKELCGEFSDKKKISEELINIEPEKMLNLIIGLFRGDGHFRLTKNNRELSLKTVSKNLAIQVSYILLMNNIKNSINLEKPKNKKIVYKVCINGEEINKIKDYDKIISKKVFNARKCSYGYLIPISKITQEHYSGDVYNLRVKDENTYVCNYLAVHNCGGGTGAMIESIANRMGVKLEDIGDVALKSKIKVNIPSKCGVFAQSSVVSKLNKGVKKEDILMGVCRGLIGNYFAMLAKGIQIEAPVIFQGATAKNKALVKSIEEELGYKVIVPKFPEFMGAFGVALITKDDFKGKTNFKGFDLKDIQFATETKYGKGCSNECEITKVYQDQKMIGIIGNRCQRCVED